MDIGGSQNWIDVWNVSNGGCSRADLQEIFNIVGNVGDPQAFESFSYILNDTPEKPFHVMRSEQQRGRLERIGDFNIDTIMADELRRNNKIQFCGTLKDGKILDHTIEFSVNRSTAGTRSHTPELDVAQSVQEVAQVVDGHWRLGGHSSNRYFEVLEADSGLDRILLLGPSVPGDDYRVRIRVTVTAWTAPLHNVGLLFNWNHHLQGDGRSLPSQWTTGLAYYYSQCDGIRIRFGQDVHYTEDGRKVGDTVPGETYLSWWRYALNRLLSRAGWQRHRLPQIVPNTPYYFELVSRAGNCSLAVWDARRRQPDPQLSVDVTGEMPSSGSLGVIAHKCGVRVHGFEYEPL